MKKKIENETQFLLLLHKHQSDKLLKQKIQLID